MPGRIFGDDDIINETTLLEIAVKVYWFSEGKIRKVSLNEKQSTLSQGIS